MTTTVLVRAFPSDVQQTGPRTLTARFVPWDVATPVADVTPTGVDRYTEGFRRGAFDAQVSSKEPGTVRRIEFVHTHEGGLGYLGHGIALRNEDDGMWGDVSILRSKAEDVADLLDSGVDGVSMEFVSLRNGTSVDDRGVRWRTKAHLVRVALEPVQAYSDARVMAFRAEDALAALDAEDEAAEVAEREAAEAVAVQQRAELDAWLAEQQAEQARLRALVGR